ncbi:hypothetical protein F907_00819 [Acinetobacter colistiniresistens]|uniref:Uncharacterized protein n=1 Tax=Acinetobacter colistiniresistens TaxID=280145 RepID=S3TD57_9GAMM|nr:hypothetical protein F907_00819 [Acinetobacter colistiniresistens]
MQAAAASGDQAVISHAKAQGASVGCCQLTASAIPI